MPPQWWGPDQKPILLPLPPAFRRTEQSLEFLPWSSRIAAIVHVATIDSRRHVKDRRGVRPVLREVKDDVDSLIW